MKRTLCTSLVALALGTNAYGQEAAAKKKAKAAKTTEVAPAPYVVPPEPLAPVFEGEAPVLFGHIWASYTEDNLALDEAVVGLNKQFDSRYSMRLSLKAVADRAYAWEAWVNAAGLFTDADWAKVGLQFLPYVKAVQTGTGAAWLAPVFTTQAGLLPERDGALSYGAKFGSFQLVFSARNDVPADKHHTYNLTLGLEATEWLKLLLAAEHSALTGDHTFVYGALVNAAGASVAAELGFQDAKDSDADDRTSFGLTGAYAFNDTWGAYAQFVSGDSAWQDSAKFKQSVALGPYVALNSYLKVALLAHSKEAEGEDGEYETVNGLTLKAEASL